MNVDGRDFSAQIVRRRKKNPLRPLSLSQPIESVGSIKLSHVSHPLQKKTKTSFCHISRYWLSVGLPFSHSLARDYLPLAPPFLRHVTRRPLNEGRECSHGDESTADPPRWWRVLFTRRELEGFVSPELGTDVSRWQPHRSR